MDFPFASRYIDNHDLVLVGYRGVDGSARLDCPEVDRRAPHTADLLGASALRASAKACAPAPTVSQEERLRPRRLHDRRSASTTSTPRARRSATTRVDLLSESFGTRVALIYAWRHPRASTGR